MNNYEFWEEYLNRVKEKIKDLKKSKKELLVDLHIHSNYSADGKQNIDAILKSTKSKGFDVIAITDHDSLEVYNELFNYVVNDLTDPIIIPGIEFTIDNKEYGNQCHMLQLFINPKDESLQKNVLKNYNATFERSKIQFKRLRQNLAIKDILSKKKINISYQEYVNYLEDNDYVPEYDTLCFYLIDKFKKVNVTTFDVFDLLKKYNYDDCYLDRRELKEKRYKVLEEKYERSELNNYNSRFLLSMLAVREVDDDWWDKPACGSLSVNSFGQLKVEDLNEVYPIYFAHPTESKLNIVEKIINGKKNILGMEINVRNKYDDINNFYNLLNKYNLVKTIGSDSHDDTLKFYEDMEVFKMNIEDLEKIIELRCK